MFQDHEDAGRGTGAAACAEPTNGPLSLQPDSAQTVPSNFSHFSPRHLLMLSSRAVAASRAGLLILSTEGALLEHWTADGGGAAPADPVLEQWGRRVVQRVPPGALPFRCANLDRESPELCLPGAPTGPFLALPMLCNGRLRGALYFARSVAAPDFLAHELDLVRPLAVWFEQGKFFDEAGLLGQLRLLNQIAQAAAGSLDLPGIIAVALRELDRHLPLHVTTIWLLDGSGSRPDISRVSCQGAVDNGPPRPPEFLTLAGANAPPTQAAEKLGLVPGQRLCVADTPFLPCLREGRAVYADLSHPDEPRDVLTTRLAVRGANSCFAVPLRAGTRDSVLRELVKLAERSWQVYDPDAMLHAIRHREELGSTALASGVAIPHPSRPLPDTVQGEAFIAFGWTPGGVPFNAPHGNLTDLFFLVCCRDATTHLRALARLSRMMLRPDFLDTLRAADTGAAALHVIDTAERDLIE